MVVPLAFVIAKCSSRRYVLPWLMALPLEQGWVAEVVVAKLVVAEMVYCS